LDLIVLTNLQLRRLRRWFGEEATQASPLQLLQAALNFALAMEESCPSV
jgi:hypothetical protein